MFYLINKPKGISSFKAIKDFAREMKIKKVGHTGTLDPLATGLLLVATDDDTKLIEYVDKGFKTYEAEMEFGFTSDSLDIDGEVIEIEKPKLTTEQVKGAIMSFQKTYMQQPPAVSAKRVNGVRAYDLARQGKEVKLAKVEVTVKDIYDIKKISEYKYSFSATVSRGTYIRSLIKDIAASLKTSAIMTDLKRIALGDLKLIDKPTEVNIESLLTLPIVELEDIVDLLNGKVLDTNKSDGDVAIKYKGDIVGIATIQSKKMKAKKLLGNKIKI